MRNFHATVGYEGKKKPFSGGPRAKTGGIFMELKVLHKGVPERVFRVYGSVQKNGSLRISIYAKGKYEVYPIELIINPEE